MDIDDTRWYNIPGLKMQRSVPYDVIPIVVHYTGRRNFRTFIVIICFSANLSSAPQDGGFPFWFPVGSLGIVKRPVASIPGVHSASNRNEYHGILLRVKSCWQLCRPSCAECQSKGGSPTFLGSLLGLHDLLPESSILLPIRSFQLFLRNRFHLPVMTKDCDCPCQ